jgi:hypothetical protein
MNAANTRNATTKFFPEVKYFNQQQATLTTVKILSIMLCYKQNKYEKMERMVLQYS